jgi:BON domain
MQRISLALVLAGVFLAFLPSSASAQRGGGGLNGGGGSMGMGSSMGMGGSGFGGGTSSFGSGMSSFGSGFGSSSFGSGFGSGSGTGGFGSGFGSSGLGGTGQSAFGNNSQNGNFIGRDSADMTSVFNQLGRNSNQFFQQMNRNMSRGGNRGNRNTSQEQNAAPPVRVRLDVAFDRPVLRPTAVVTAVRGRLEKVLVNHNITAPDVELKGDTVVLRGVAASESQRLVIEKLVSLEPGVLAVDNQMTVAPAATEPQPSSLPPAEPRARN